MYILNTDSIFKGSCTNCKRHLHIRQILMHWCIVFLSCFIDFPHGAMVWGTAGGHGVGWSVLEHRWNDSYVIQFVFVAFLELKCFRSHSELNPIFISVQTSQWKRMFRDFPNVASQVTKQMATLLLVQQLSSGRFRRCCRKGDCVKPSDFQILCVGNGEYGSDFRDTTLRCTDWTIQEGPGDEDMTAWARS